MGKLNLKIYLYKSTLPKFDTYSETSKLKVGTMKLLETVAKMTKSELLEHGDCITLNDPKLVDKMRNKTCK